MAAPKADAFATVYDKATDKCTITFTDTNARRINDAYEGLFLRMGEQVRDGFPGEPAKADAQVVWEYGLREDEKSATDLPVPADPAIPSVQTRLALGSVAGGAIGGFIFGGGLAAPIASSGKEFRACEERENLNGSAVPGCSLISSQATGIGIAGLVAGILALTGAGFALPLRGSVHGAASAPGYPEPPGSVVRFRSVRGRGRNICAWLEQL